MLVLPLARKAPTQSGAGPFHQRALARPPSRRERDEDPVTRRVPRTVAGALTLAVAFHLIVSSSIWAQEHRAAPNRMALLPAGVHKPLFRGPDDPKEVPVRAFYLDVFPVTNGEFLDFVRANARWQRSRVKRLFADENYLRHWSGDLEPGESAPTNAPVVNVSWFAAKAYAAWKGKRLPTVAEWEYAALASATRADGGSDPAQRRQILEWYGQPTPPVLPAVGRRAPNCWGVHDLHGLVWEWVADFNTALVTGESRGDTGLERQLFCGPGSQGAQDRADYPAFIRYGFRSSLQAAYTVRNLGFRCAKDATHTGS